MKVIAIERNFGTGRDELAALLSAERVPSPVVVPSTVIADSALVRVSTPMFVPDFASGWMLRVVPYVTIGRLGKSILPRFASRYMNGFGIGVRLLPPACGLTAANTPPLPEHSALSATFDGAFAPGTPLPMFSAEESLHIEACQKGAAEGCQTFDVNPHELHLDDTVALVSRYMTLRTGDIISPCLLPIEFPATLNSVVEVKMNGETTLKLKIK